MSLILNLTAIASATILSSQAVEAPQQRHQTLEQLAACRAITDGAARLNCYDAAAAAVDSAQRQGELVVIDRAQAEGTRRQLFGFDAAALPRLFGGGEAADIQAIETTLESATQGYDGRWVFRLADGGVWRQVDTERVRFQNRPGQAVGVRKAALGSFLMTVGDSRAVRVRRQ